MGDLGTAAVTTAIMLGALVLMLPVREWVRRRVARDERRLRIGLREGASSAGVVAALRTLDDVTVESLSVEKEEGAYLVVVHLRAGPHTDLDARLI